MATELELIVGPRSQADGTADGPIRVSRMGSQVVTDAHGRYYEATRLGNMYSIVATNITNPTGAYPLGAGGTPFVAIWNPPGSGRNLFVIQVSVAVRNYGTTTGIGSVGLSGGPTATITGTATAALNLLSLQTIGASAKAYSNTALTGSTALNAIRPVFGFGAATGVTISFSQLATEDTSGSIIVIPGNVVALSCSVTGSGATPSTTDCGMIWEEVPI